MSAACGGLLLAAMTADLFVDLPAPIRWGLWCASSAILAALLAGKVLRPWSRPVDWIGLASLAERHQPSTIRPGSERLTSAVDLQAAARRGTAHGSPELIAALEAQAESEVASIAPRQVVPASAGWTRFLQGAAAIATIALLVVLLPDPFAILARRALAPWSSEPRVSWFAVAQVTPGTTRVAQGTDVVVEAQVTPRWPWLTGALEWLGAFSGIETRAAQLAWTDDAGQARSLPMTELDSRSTPAFRARVPHLERTIHYQVTAGDARSALYHIEPVAPPTIVQWSARVVPPSYTKLPDVTLTAPASIEAIEDSKIVLNVKASSLLKQFDVMWPHRREAELKSTEDQPSREQIRTLLVPTPSDAVAFEPLTAEVSGVFSFGLTSADGLASRPDTPKRLVVRPDRPPTVVLEENLAANTKENANAKDSAEALTEVQADDLVLASARAEDDLGVGALELHYEIIDREGNSRGNGQVTLDTSGLDSPTARGDAAIKLKSLGVQAGERVVYRAKVIDSLPPPRGPQVAWSEPRMLRIVSQAEPLLTRQSEAHRKAIQQKIDALKQKAAANRRETEQLRYAADAARRRNGPWEKEQQAKLQQRTGEARGLRQDLDELARELEDDPPFAPLAPTAREIAENEADAGRDRLDQAERANDPEQRLTKLQDADAALGAVQGRLDELQQQFDKLVRQQTDRHKLRVLAERQAALAAQAEDLAKPGQPAQAEPAPAPDRAQLDRLHAEQNAIKREFEETLRRSPELRAEALQAQAREADALAQTARELADRQRQEAREASDPKRLDPALAALVEDQRKLQADTRRLAIDVDTKLTENGRARMPIDPLQRAEDALRQGEPSQIAQRLEEARQELARASRELRDLPTDPKTQAQRLERRQSMLRDQVDQATSPVRNKAKLEPKEQGDLERALAPLAKRQEELTQQAKALANALPPAQRDAAQRAIEAQNQAAANLAPDRRKESVNKQNAAAQALRRLADAIPDRYRRLESARRASYEIYRRESELARQVERLVRDTSPRPDQPFDPQKAREEVARRAEPMTRDQNETIKRLENLDPTPEFAPQHQRALARAKELAKQLDSLRQANGDAEHKNQAEQTKKSVEPAALAAEAGSLRLYQAIHDQPAADQLAAELANDQRELARQAQTARPEQRARLADRQRGLAAAASALEAKDAPDAQKAAAQQAEHAAKAIEAGKTDPKPSLEQAARAFEQLAKELGGDKPPAPAQAPNPPTDPELGLKPEQIDEADALRRRQRQLLDRFRAAVAERVPDQQAIQKDSRELGEKLGDLRDRARQLSAPAQGNAAAAADTATQHAPNTMAQGIEQLQQGRPNQARDHQRRAADMLNQASQQLEDFAAALRAEQRAANRMAQNEPNRPADNATEGQPLDDASKAMEQARQRIEQARGNSPEPSHAPAQTQAAGEAGQAMRQAAQALRQAAATPQPQGQPGGEGQQPPGQPSDALAQSPPGDPTNPSDPNESPTEPRANPAGQAQADLTQLVEELRRANSRAWGRLPGQLRNEILQMAKSPYREDYAQLIRLYFREIAGSAANPEPTRRTGDPARRSANEGR